MKLRLATASLVLAAAALAPAQAAVRYTFSGSNVENIPAAFSLTVPDFITVDTFFPVESLDSCSAITSSCGGVTFNMDGVEYNTPPDILTAGLQVIEFGIGDGRAFFHYFAPTPGLPFSTPGIYSTSFDFNPATLTVAVVTAVPEPMSMEMLLVGVGVMAGVLRRRRRVGGAR